MQLRVLCDTATHKFLNKIQHAFLFYSNKMTSMPILKLSSTSLLLTQQLDRLLL